MRLASALLLTFVPAALSYGQTTAAKKPAVVRHTTTAATPAANALPPNIPKVPGIAKPLYALKYIDVLVGTGPLAEPTILGTSQADSKIEFYTVKYTGWLAKDGTKFDSSFDHPGGEPITFPFGLHRVIPGWDTGFDGMHIGGKRRLFIPWQLAYGESGRSPIPARADLIFDIELVAVSDKPPAPPTPPAAPVATPNPAPKPEAAPVTTTPPPPAHSDSN